MSYMEIGTREADERSRFVRCALEYLATPYHHGGRIKGAGVDCATLLICAAKDAGLIDDFQMPYYSPQWHLNRNSQEYLARMTRFCVEVEPPALSGDIALFQFGRAFSHGAIVVDWPRIVHAYIGRNVCIDDAEKAQWLAFVGEGGPLNGKQRPMKLMSLWRR